MEDSAAATGLRIAFWHQLHHLIRQPGLCLETAMYALCVC